MTFQRDPFLCPDAEKISNFVPDVKNQHFSARTLGFVLKRSTIGLIIHKNAIKHENIGTDKFFRPLKYWLKLVFGIFKPEGEVSIARFWY